ncbi:hypothetical protein COW98_01830 [Candidatus Roizmanbacteria bacterium CG22_combo_CG10-13_8_21_14_all_35_9]|uniref:DNA-directed DNA polymerase n=4 Tax=Candidatus Roizmaniibacteriota TaxID=1752723 RepID=A0A2M8F342_9BACT|nr:hypothetical protein [Candidatus Roizmanbacteria bacterium]PIP14990.1 MAG: hypothetical protein COX47_02180 [Candidatus Roizmanbacteria bacterium CG23_combo_of_CG06-09_8_20_14_all_35_49]PIP62834.1 MAG: hypothetical protein COW98_01830 [Candidatus Roizmanbacteria bacterium CG22_combo_CG10-13_8_21_14_all_35_9]PIY71306.1 MAG: hypothetical protein COY88_01000 [Candidatus Roizmanbacteria bacterium CG_4_10_14_0_8_um_filter_35_28]PJC33705.1 MAG: hypothetical protein CO048_02560 [Candidatus Roizmanb
MLTIICGEDSTTSFNYYSSLKKNYLDKSYEILDVSSSDLENITSWLGQSQSLFSQKKIFFTQNINKRLSRKLNLKINKVVEKLIKDKSVEVVDWEEEIPSRELKFPKATVVKEFKPAQNIFKLQDSLYPGNLKNFIYALNQLAETVDENIIFYMLVKHIRNLLTVKSGQSISRLQPWQLAKLSKQAKNWEEKKLLGFYQGLHRIDISTKTSSNPFSLKKSLDILACYFL